MKDESVHLSQCVYALRPLIEDQVTIILASDFQINWLIFCLKLVSTHYNFQIPHTAKMKQFMRTAYPAATKPGKNKESYYRNYQVSCAKKTNFHYSKQLFSVQDCSKTYWFKNAFSTDIN